MLPDRPKRQANDAVGGALVPGNGAVAEKRERLERELATETVGNFTAADHLRVSTGELRGGETR